MSDSRINRTRKQARHLKIALQTTVNPLPAIESILWPDSWLTADEARASRADAFIAARAEYNYMHHAN